jgi:hypothetical protein
MPCLSDPKGFGYRRVHESTSPGSKVTCQCRCNPNHGRSNTPSTLESWDRLNFTRTILLPTDFCLTSRLLHPHSGALTAEQLWRPSLNPNQFPFTTVSPLLKAVQGNHLCFHFGFEPRLIYGVTVFPEQRIDSASRTAPTTAWILDSLLQETIKAPNHRFTGTTWLPMICASNSHWNQGELCLHPA